jgi:hypothetical protein
VKLALALFGLPRCSGVTFPSIVRNLAQPLAAAGELHVRYHLFRQERVVNPRTGEDHALDEANYAPFLQFRGILEPPSAVDPQRMQRLKRFGDAWANGYVSLGNLLLQLHSLLQVTQAVAEVAPDVVLFARADLLVHDPVTPQQIEACMAEPGSVALPAWESWGGYNDRLALAGARAYRAYGGRLLLADHYCETLNRPLHSETFLRHALAFAGVAARMLPLRASRVRADGRVEIEDFGGHVTPLADFRAPEETGPRGP